MRLFHATKISNKDGIKRVGLKLNRVSSGYGKTPTHNAVYLYCIYNVDVACDMIDLFGEIAVFEVVNIDCLLYTSPSPRDRTRSRMPSSA